jgi:hypothetical protein
VRAFCAEHGIAYRETGFLASCAQVLRHLHTVGSSLGPELELLSRPRPATSLAGRIPVSSRRALSPRGYATVEVP